MKRRIKIKRKGMKERKRKISRIDRMKKRWEEIEERVKDI